MKKTGFALLTPEQRKMIAKRGAIINQELGIAHKWTSETAKSARKKRKCLFQKKDD